MKNLIKSLILGFILALIYLPPLHAQTEGGTSADTSSSAAGPTTPGQAPDQVMKKLSDLVHAGKYAEAQQLTAGLLLAYPDDQRLLKARALLDKSLATAGATTATLGGNPPMDDVVSTQPTASTKGQQLAGMDKVDYTALIELARQAQESTDLPQQTKLLQQFMGQSSLFLQKHPNVMMLWELRAASAISLNDPLAGYEAGQRLLAMGAADSNDSNGQRLLAQLKNKGWLDMEAAAKQAEHLQKSEWILGTWTLHYSGIAAKGQKFEGNEIEEFSRSSDSAVDGYNLKKDGSKRESPNVRVTFPDSGEMHFDSVSATRIVQSFEVTDHNRTMTVVFIIPDSKKGKYTWWLHKNDDAR
jgi:hypothetical protein